MGKALCGRASNADARIGTAARALKGAMSEAVTRTDLEGLKLLNRGKVRDIYEVPEGLLIVDNREQVVLANKAFSDLFGKSSTELLGLKASEFRSTSCAQVHTWKTMLWMGSSTMVPM